MEMKPHALSRPGKQIRLSAADIRKQPLTDSEKLILANIAAQQAAEDAIKSGSEQGLNVGAAEKQLVGVRLDADVLAWLESYGEAYSTHINNILRSVMESGTH